ncbi:Embryo-specific protein ATS3B, partial [Cucurbita argyrosperma subsp. sororia]
MKRVLCFLLTSALLLALLEATELLPESAESFNLTYIQQLGSCSYSVVISTSCSSPTYTRDQISVSFGDAYGNQIYVPRIDDPSRRIFERCSSDTFSVSGPCAYQICYVYLYRTGPDAWIPTTVKISGPNSRPVTFNYNTAIPNDRRQAVDASALHGRHGTHLNFYINPDQPISLPALLLLPASYLPF